VELSSELTAGLRELSRRHGTTLFMTLLSGWSVLLSRLSGQMDVVIGTPVANRQRAEVEGLIGFFVNTLALRVRLEDDPKVSELIARVRQISLEAFANQDVPFEQVVEVLNPPRSLSHSPIFQATLALNNTADAWELSLPDLQLSVLERRVGTSHFDLSLSLTEIDGKLLGTVDYARDLFEQETIRRWVGHLQQVLCGMVSDDRQRAGQLSLLRDPEREQVLVEFNATRVAYECERLIHEPFERQAQRNAGAVALEIKGRQLSYGELNRRANQLAHFLISSGVRPDDRVAICVERTVEMVIGWLGVLKAGGAYVPLDPGYPSARLAYMLSDSAPVCVLTQSKLREVLPESTVPVLLLDEESALAGQSEHDPDARALGLSPSHLAYVIYTSGSTGQPKGVMVEHRHVANLVQWHCDAFELSAGSRCSCVAAVGFDAAAWEIWPSLSVGATLVLASPEVSADAQALLEWWASQALDVSFLPTPLAELAFRRNTLNAGVRALLVGGDQLRYRPQSPPFALINNYGPTEATVVATSGRINDQDPTVHIGRPIANTQIYILDGHLQPVPIGVAGEIHIGGAQVARGYLNREALTAQRFIENPFGARGSRLYKSGDLGRWGADGTIEYLGRNDSQVKIRGFRIELGEIETQLSACESVREVVVVAREYAPGDMRLVAYYTTVAGAEVSAEILKSHLSRTLASYMVPQAYVQLPALPMTLNGKLDRKALPAPDDSAVPRREFKEPVGEVEQMLAQIWQELLGVQRVGRHDHFFEIGGHSLALTQLSLRIKELHGADVGIARLYASHTLQDMAATIAAHLHRAQSEVNGGTIVTLEI
jgi:amino acid adenylation domain-containing protein